MTKDDLVKFAEVCDLGEVTGPLNTLLDHEWEDLHRFAQLIENATLEKAAAACENVVGESDERDWIINTACLCAKTIRKLSNSDAL
jgi:hypothetical protein